ncbi:MAG: TonB-dependent receptor plug domain-containing protein [Bacteroidota bacterium]
MERGLRHGRADSLFSPPRADALQRDIILHEVVVVATRLLQEELASPSPVTVITRREIETSPGLSLGGLLAGTAGIMIRSYGGAGGLQTISLRGYGSEHTLVSFNGVRLNSVENGAADLSLLSPLFLEKIEILRGGASSLYGADAVSGVIQLVMFPAERVDRGSSPWQSDRHEDQQLTHGILDQMHFKAEIGSDPFGGVRPGRIGALFHWESNAVGFRAGFVRDAGEGAYRFIDHTGLRHGEAEQTREWNNYQTVQGLIASEWALTPSLRLNGFVFLQDSHRGVPGPYTGTSHPATQDNRDFLGNISVKWRGASRGAAGEGIIPEFHLNTNFRSSVLHYRDPWISFAGKALDSWYHESIFTQVFTMELAPARTFRALFDAELSLQQANAEELGGIHRRWQWSLAATGDWAVHNFISVYPSIRIDHFTGFGTVVSPRIGTNAVVFSSSSGHAVHLRGSLGKNFRAPTFNDLYWLPGGNPDLRPERSISADLGLSYIGSLLGTERVDVGIFSINTRDRILWKPLSRLGQTLWVPMNIDHVWSRGIESNIEWMPIGKKVLIRGSYTFQRATKENAERPGDPTAGKQLLYVPKELLSGEVRLMFERFDLVVRHQFVGYRFTAEDNRTFLPSYNVTDASLVVRYPFRHWMISVKFDVNNLFNTDYQVLALYPMPLRNFAITLTIQR